MVTSGDVASVGGVAEISTQLVILEVPTIGETRPSTPNFLPKIDLSFPLEVYLSKNS